MLQKLFEKPEKLVAPLIVFWVIIILIISVLATYVPETVSKLAAAATWLSGVIGPLISLAALCLLFYTYKTQKEELESTKRQLTNQNAIIDQQKFETTLFNLIQLLKENAKQFAPMLPPLIELIIKPIQLNDFYPSMSTAQGLSDGLMKAYADAKNRIGNRSEMGRYFRVLQYILEFIDRNQSIDTERKTLFYQLIETTMTDDELFVTFFECYSKGFGDSFTRTVKSADLLTNYLQYRKHSIPTTMRDSYILNKS